MPARGRFGFSDFNGLRFWVGQINFLASQGQVSYGIEAAWLEIANVLLAIDCGSCQTGGAEDRILRLPGRKANIIRLLDGVNPLSSEF
jgi:hypothetical protein